MQIEITIREEGGTSGAASGKTITLIAADRHGTSIRSHSFAQSGPGPTPYIDVDARPEILSDGKLRVNLGLDYRIDESGDQTGPNGAPAWVLSQRMSLIVRSGQALVISKATDPHSGRTAAVQVTATILK